MADGRGVAFLPWGSAVVWCARPAHQATLPPAGTTDGQPVLRLVGPGGRPEEPRETEDISQPTRGDSGPLDTAATVRGPRIRQSAHAESPDPEELKRLEQQVRRVVTRKLRLPSDTEDVVVEAMRGIIRAWQDRRYGRHSGPFTEALVVTIAATCCCRWLRARYRDRARTEEFAEETAEARPDPRAETDLTAVVFRDALRAFKDLLHPRERALFTYAFEQDLTDREIATLTAQSDGAVKKQRQRLVQRLQTLAQTPDGQRRLRDCIER